MVIPSFLSIIDCPSVRRNVKQDVEYSNRFDISHLRMTLSFYLGIKSNQESDQRGSVSLGSLKQLTFTLNSQNERINVMLIMMIRSGSYY